MAVHHALRVARGATCVTHARGLILVDNFPFDRLGSSKQCLVFVHFKTRHRRRHFTLAVIHEHKVLDGGECGEQWLDQWIDRCIDEDHFVFSMIHDVGELFREQTNVERVQHTTRTGSCKIQLEVTLRVPGKRGHATHGRDTKVVEHTSEATCAICPLAICRALPTSGRRRDDLLVAVILLRAIEQVANRQLSRLHQTLHNVPQGLGG